MREELGQSNSPQLESEAFFCFHVSVISKASMYSCIMSLYHVMNNVYISVVLSIDGTDIDIAINVISGSVSPKL